MARRTTLGLAGLPRSAPFLAVDETLPTRPPGPRLTHLGLHGVVRSRRRAFSDKASAVQPPRPDIELTRLSLLATPGRRRAFTPKAPLVGISGRTTVTVTPSAGLYYGRRYTVYPNVVTNIRPMNARITVARVNRISGFVSVSIRVQATRLRYRRHGQEHSIQGNAGFSILPFGGVVYRTWKRFSGQAGFTITPQAGLVYTPAPVRHHRIRGSVRTRFTPAGHMVYTDRGLAHEVSGSSSISIEVRGRISVVRQTTYATHGRVTVTITPQGRIEKGEGPPVAYHISGRTFVSVVPQGRMGVAPGEFHQYAIVGDVRFEVQPRGRMQFNRAPVLPSSGRRRFIRIW